MKKKNECRPDRIMTYFAAEWNVLLWITVSGLIYNLGLMAGPWFEGKMAGCLMQILTGNEQFPAMLRLALAYVAAIGTVQLARYIKRFYVRRFANQVNRQMKKILYGTLVHRSRTELEQEGTGNIITKAVSDVDDCVEGMRKFTTEIFDTGVALLGYIGMLLWYDWKLALCCLVFPPVSYVIAEKMKGIVQRTGAFYKEKSGMLNAATLDRIENAVTYRVFGCEKERGNQYEKCLTEYEHAAVKANIWNTALPPLYKAISMTGTMLILYIGSKNVLGNGWSAWDVAAFTTFLACYTKLSDKSSKAAKLFNAVHKAQVSWKRIHPYMEQAANASQKDSAEGKDETRSAENPGGCAKNDMECGGGNAAVKDEPGACGTCDGKHVIAADRLTFSYPGGTPVFEHLSFTAKPGQIIGITGPVACGKSTLGKTFLCEYPYDGHLTYGGRELSSYPDKERSRIIGYLGHDPELFGDSIEQNVMFGDHGDVWKWLRIVCLDKEVEEMEEKEKTIVGNGGVRLSGGQAARLALARTLCHAKPVMILDDPFSALDRDTECKVFAHIRELAKDRIVFLISHRLYLFPELDQVIWMDEKTGVCGSHRALMESCRQYAELYQAQTKAPESGQKETDRRKPADGPEKETIRKENIQKQNGTGGGKR